MDTQYGAMPVQRDFDSAIPVRQELAASIPAPQGFTIEDILWAIGIWSVILCLSPVIVFYMLMVA